MTKTRKIRRSIKSKMNLALPLQYLPKARGPKGGRNLNMTTFKTVCNPKDANAHIVGLKSLKPPDPEVDYFVHVALAKYYGNGDKGINEKELVIKLQSRRTHITNELNIYNILKGKNNIIHFICDFPCMFNKIRWSKPLTKPSSLCEESGTPYHMIIMEYINNDLADFLEANQYTENMFNSIVRQVGLSLMEIHMNYRLCHGDINRGNILLETGGEPKDIVYRIGDLTETVSTEGNEVIWIDFQHGIQMSKTEPININQNENGYLGSILQSTLNEISRAYDIMEIWTKNEDYKKRLTRGIDAVIDAKTSEELFNVILHI